MAFFKELIVRITGDTSGLQKATKQAQTEVSSFEKGLQKLGPGIAAAFSVGAVSAFVGQIISVRSEFAKYEAVLKNSLGSSKSAADSMAMLQSFAAKTPFQLNELTNSYVKLINRGLKPTEGQMTALGDLASSTGKSFDQLAEAMLDAMTGENERLKEFGIIARDMGDKTAYTFKGVTTEVEKTSKAISDYIISLGNAKGVTGAMNEISKTLGGQISNLKDQFTAFLNDLGKRSDSVISGAISALSALFKVINKPLDERSWFGKLLFTNSLTKNMDAQKATFQNFVDMMQNTPSTGAVMGPNPSPELEPMNRIATLVGEISKLKKDLVTVNDSETASIIRSIAAKEEELKLLTDIGYANEKAIEAKKLAVQLNGPMGPSPFENLPPGEYGAGQLPTKTTDKVTITTNKKLSAPSVVLSDENLARLDLQAQKYAAQYNEMVKLDTITNTLVSSLEELGNSLQYGADSWADFGKMALNALKGLVAGIIAKGIASAITNSIEASGPLGPFAVGIGAAAGGLAAGAFSTLVPSFAEGGIVNSPTLALVGDNPGRREAIIPSELFGKIGGGGRLYTDISGRNLRIILDQEYGTQKRMS